MVASAVTTPSFATLFTASPARLERLLGRLRVLVVDADPLVAERVADALESGENRSSSVFAADSPAAAVATLGRLRDAGRDVDLVLVDRGLGDAAAVWEAMRQLHPEARRVVTCGRPCLDAGLDAIRGGALDYLAKPLPPADALRARLVQVAGHRYRELHTDRRLRRLKSAVRQLNLARRVVGKKVDLLCNDLVAAYGEVTKKLEHVRVHEDLRKLLDGADDLESLLCHTMDWLLRKLGHCNIAIFLSDDDGDSELGAYMKHTVAGEEPLTQWLGEHVVPLAADEGYAAGDAALFGDLTAHLPDALAAAMLGQSLAAAECRYMSEPLATLVLFRRADKMFAEEDAEVIRAAAGVFAIALTNLVKHESEDDGYDDGADDGYNGRGLGDLI